MDTQAIWAERVADAARPATKRHKGNVAATKAAMDPGARDPRLPPVGTVLGKVDRHGATRCECKVVEGGFEYKDEFLKSLSGLRGGQRPGGEWHSERVRFLGIVRAELKAKNPIHALEKAWDRYSARVKDLSGAELDAGTRKQVAELLEEQGKKIADTSEAIEQTE